MKVCQNFIKSYVPGKYLLADALSCPPGMFHLGCKVPAKLSMCNPLGKIRHPLLWQEQNCLKEQNCISSLWLHENVGVEKETKRGETLLFLGRVWGFFLRQKGRQEGPKGRHSQTKSKEKQL